jgi:aspartyl-tRNA(Asn)/glutamyl-tRNA(Gln) amidotransferase subunit A
MHNATLAELSEALRARRVSSVELTRLFLERAERFNGALNAFITLDPERSLAQAADADRRIAAGQAGALTGIPIAHKDIFCCKGWLTSCGSRMLSNFVAPYDAQAIERLHEAGLVTLGKTNMDEFAMGSSTESSYYGPVRNPWDLAAVPGGSSGGSACAVAARLAPAATGTDTGGSIRQPAAHCGISDGMVAFASSLDQGGPMAKSAADLAWLLGSMTGYDPRDSTSLERPAQDYARALNEPLKGQRIGLPKEYFGAGLEADVRGAVEAAVAQYRTLGCEVVDISLPNTRLCIPVYYVLAPAEASSNLARYDGVRYGFRAHDYGDLQEMYLKSRAQAFGAEVKRRILVGTYVLSHGYYDAYYLKAQKLRRLIAEDFARAFEHCDLILGPTAPSVAFDLGAKRDDPVQMYLSDIYTVSVNLAGLPGLSIPCGFGANGRPIGLQMVGNYFQEARMLNAAHQYQLATDWHLRMPPGVE